MLPAYRPQEFLLAQAVDAVVRRIRQEACGERSPIDFVVTTGDNTDSAQENELDAFLTLMDGGELLPARDTGNSGHVTTIDGAGNYWNPEPYSRDEWKERRGFPDYPGAISAAAAGFRTPGLGLPWLGCFGNHDCLVQGRAAAPPGYNTFLNGERKPIDKPPERQSTRDALAEYRLDPLWVSSGPSMPIQPDVRRRVLSKREHVGRHLASSTLPRGHGFSAENLQKDTAYYTYDGVSGLRVITLDTTNPAGGVNGCLDPAQYSWLEERLREVHAPADRPAAGEIHTGYEDRLVVICSHHGLSTLDNDTALTPAEPLYLADEVERLLHRYPNVVLWLSGHTHVNRVTARPRPGGGGFWEISTSSIAEWPVQIRRLSIAVLNGRGVRIRSTIIDSGAPIRSTGGTTLADLAALHREVAANDPGSVGGADAQGTPADRNVDLLVPLPPQVLNRILKAEKSP
jgi:metallophosphoesterase (TIGR03767 family)